MQRGVMPPVPTSRRSSDDATMLVRPRMDDDIESLCKLIRRVHLRDGYPVKLQSDVRSFIVTSNCHAAWVAEACGSLVGHVSLHTVWSDAVAALAWRARLPARSTGRSLPAICRAREPRRRHRRGALRCGGQGREGAVIASGPRRRDVLRPGDPALRGGQLGAPRHGVAGDARRRADRRTRLRRPRQLISRSRWTTGTRRFGAPDPGAVAHGRRPRRSMTRLGRGTPSTGRCRRTGESRPRPGDHVQNHTAVAERMCFGQGGDK